MLFFLPMFQPARHSHGHITKLAPNSLFPVSFRISDTREFVRCCASAWVGFLSPFNISGASLRYFLVLRKKGASEWVPYFLSISFSGILSNLAYWTKSPLCHDSIRESKRLVCQPSSILRWHFGHFESSS